ncbi:Carboxymuconolactone decarboxylase family protein [Burkholderia sp. YR290]|nr:Carboxymuconolactone decarboxylase family protein [Burkholderia sp. YR290]
MQLFAPTLVACCVLGSMSAVRAAPDTRPAQDIEAVAPQLHAYTQNLLFGDVWKRPELSSRDRSLITMSALVAGGHTAQMPGHFKARSTTVSNPS